MWDKTKPARVTDAPSPPPVERAREARRLVTLPAYALLENRSTISVTVLDLSYDGCNVETPAPLQPGSHITLSVLKLGKLDAHVRWYLDGKAGLTFRPDPARRTTHQPRQHRRIALTADVSLRSTGRPSYNVRANDVSPSGCKVEFVERPEVGDRLWVKFNGLDALEAEVRWVVGYNGGVRFTRAIYPAVFELMLARLI